MSKEKLLDDINNLNELELNDVEKYVEEILNNRKHKLAKVKKAYNLVICYCVFAIPRADSLGDYVRLNLKVYTNSDFISNFERLINDLTSENNTLRSNTEYDKEYGAVLSFLVSVEELSDELHSLNNQTVSNDDIVRYFTKVMQAGNISGCTKLFGYGIEV